MGNEKWIRAAFRSINGIGSGRLRQLIAVFGSALKAWEASDSELDYLISKGWLWLIPFKKNRTKIEIEHLQEDYYRKGIKLVTPGEPHYPKLLEQLPDSPPLLYYKGTLNSELEGMAIVGARKATSYGKAAARQLARELVEAKFAVISGLARGIDTCAHEGAITANGVTWAYLGCGLDIVYPRENQKLADQLTERGALLSEFPPGTPPDAPHFPARNRLISGTSRGVIVVEAALKSGALITVDFALEQGREVFAVPGPIFSEMSKGTNHLLRMGAKIVEGLDDITSEINYPFVQKTKSSLYPNKATNTSVEMIELSEQQKMDKEHLEILRLLSDLPMHIDQIVTKCTYPSQNILLALLELELQGEVEQLPGQCYVLARHG